MAKTYTQRPVNQFDQVKPESLNDNLDEYLSEYNGRLDSNNMPVQSVDNTKLAEPVVKQLDQSLSTLGFGVEFPSQAIYQVDRWGWKNNGGDPFTPYSTISLRDVRNGKGFSPLHQEDGWDLTKLNFDAKQGMLVGTATIDWHHGTDNEMTSGGPTFGFQWWTEWAVFVNNIQVATTGWMYPRRHTTNLPFSIPIGSQNVTIDIRFRTNTGGRSSAAFSSTYTGPTPIHMFGAEIVCRNVYR